MDQSLYFQWQNDFLRQTIYPLREMKLRDFLVFYKEIDLWKEYGHKTESAPDIRAEIETYKRDQVKIWLDSLAAYTDARQYFISDVTEASWLERHPLIPVDSAELAQINRKHSIFISWFPKLKNPRSENYFISQRVYEWETHRKGLVHEISECQRKMRNYEPFMGETDPHHDRYRALHAQQEAELERLQTKALKMADAEMDALYGFLSMSNRLEKRRTDLALERAAAQRKTDDATRQIAILTARLAPLQAKHAAIAADLARLKDPPNRADLEQYFVDPLPASLVTAAPTIVDLLGKLQSAHAGLKNALQSDKPDSSLQLAAQNASWLLKNGRTEPQRRVLELESNLRNMPANWSHRAERQAEHDGLMTALSALDAELGKLSDYVAVLARATRSPAQTVAIIQQKEQERATAEATISQLRDQIKVHQDAILGQAAILQKPDEDRLAEFSPTQVVTVREIARGRGEAYRASLLGKDHKDLLEMVVQRFLAEPERYPLWLQYMVVHFSGMRYASAHGSWADPRDLLMNLRTPALEADFKKLDQNAVDALCIDKINSYESAAAGDQPGPAQRAPALSKSTDKLWRAKIAIHLRNMHSVSPYYRRKGLFDLLVDEETCDIEQLSDSEVTDALQLARVSRPIPDWMWREIVAVVPGLRVSEVRDADWEHLTPQQEAERNRVASAQDRLLISLWKQDNLTGWREEHTVTDQLIVSRAVCNEVAEHIQHLRGNIPGGGLTAKPQWYMSKVSQAAKTMRKEGELAPYLLRASLANLREGASILWLQFVYDFPNEWRIAHPMKVSDGQELLPAELFTGRDGALRGSWHYQLEAGTVKRDRIAADTNGARFNEVQWLRWIHEATVVDVAETADGTVVLTFETALPYEDKRLSTIGVFKHDPSYTTYSVGGSTINGAFVGYVPPGDLPFKNLEGMLDWNKILLREALTPADLGDWRAKHLGKTKP
jgi:hypothetical protein